MELYILVALMAIWIYFTIDELQTLYFIYRYRNAKAKRTTLGYCIKYIYIIYSSFLWSYVIYTHIINK